ncbi:hypothetical protein [Azospirillum rugosum]|uniref:Transposase n=1 Tax=Azospirillum rugosum TaxID=416170 RepID=A0ABS4SPM2_9PROT|nr:hypothetical protein [Azospirillum rugosum]MBP2293902.1 hypothetical protein [Azospirillum rugosum]MDQ0526911.1 hypothetical protein [Azospirillum rugosum]
MDPDKLAKVLAMAESDHQGEALSALRAARIMLSRAGMSFRDLARGAAGPAPVAAAAASTAAAPPDRPPPPDQLVQGLRRQVRDLELEIAGLKRQLEKSSGDMERHREEADRWRTLARETAEKLWDLGKALERKHSRHTSADKRRAILDQLQDPGSALLADHEIARRVGTSPKLVAHWRRRLAIVGRKIRLLPVVPRGRGLWGGGPARHGQAKLGGAPHGPRRRWMGYPVAVTISDRSGSDRVGDRHGTRR